MKNNAYWVWLDLEMTGLNPEVDKIIEIAVVVTDNQLNLIAEGPQLAIHQSDALLDGMDKWNTRQHNKSGLVERVKASTVTEEEAEKETLAFLSQYLDAGHSPVCGNSVWQDRRFLVKYMPNLSAFFHYRNLDVSTLKILAQVWQPSLKKFEKESKHLAMDDIKDSIDELKYYRTYFNKPLNSYS